MTSYRFILTTWKPDPTALPGESDSDKLNRERGDELINAARDGNISKVTVLLAEGANINARNSFGMSPIMMAAMGKHYDIVKLLKTKNPDLTFTNGGYGVTRLWGHACKTAKR